MSEKIDLTYVPITGPGVDAFNNRKETGCKHEVTEQEMHESLDRMRPKLSAGLKLLRLAAIARFTIPR